MYRGRTVAVVVPAYNEEGLVGDVITSMPALVDRTYVVDDASTDGTWAEIQSAAATVDGSRPAAGESAVATSTDGAGAATDPGGGSVRQDGADGSQEAAFDRRVVPLQHDRNRGVGGAIKTGYRRAIEDGVDLVAVMGGDGQMNPNELPRYLDPLVDDEADYVKGNRFMADDIGAMPRFRLLGNALLSLLTKIASGYWTIGDPQNGYTAATTDALEAAGVEDMYEYYGYCNDLLVKLRAADQRVADIPRSSAFTYGGDATSHITYSEYIPRVSWMLLRNFLGRLRRRGGAAVAGSLLGAILVATGMALVVAGRRRGGLGVVLGSALLVGMTALDYRRGAALGRRLDPAPASDRPDGRE